MPKKVHSILYQADYVLVLLDMFLLEMHIAANAEPSVCHKISRTTLIYALLNSSNVI